MKADPMFYLPLTKLQKGRIWKKASTKMLLLLGKKKPWAVAIKGKWFLI